MKNLKLLSFWLLCWTLVLMWCNTTTETEDYACEGEEVCPIEINDKSNENGIEIEESPDIVVDANDWDLNGNGEWYRYDEWNLEWDLSYYEWGEDVAFENNEQVNEEPEDSPMWKIVIDENSSLEEIENSEAQVCEALWWVFDDWDCTLADGSKVYF